MIKISVPCLSLTFLLTSVAAAQDGGAISRKQAFAVRVAEGSIHVDGRLDEPAWAQATAIADFVQKEPNEGAPPTEKMEIRFVPISKAFKV